jgi:ribosomal protein S27AE
MKQCRSCKANKDFSEFYVHKAMADGYLNMCKDCVKNRVSKHRIENIERIKEYEKKRGNLAHRVLARKQYIKTDAGKIAKKRGLLKYKQQHPLRYAAHIIVGNAVRDGILHKPKTCSECASTEKIEGHHDDYTKPLEVRWVCEKCHKQWHRLHKPKYQ